MSKLSTEFCLQYMKQKAGHVENMRNTGGLYSKTAFWIRNYQQKCWASKRIKTQLLEVPGPLRVSEGKGQSRPAVNKAAPVQVLLRPFISSFASSDRVRSVSVHVEDPDPLRFDRSKGDFIPG